MDPATALSINLLTRMAIAVRIEARQTAMFVIDTGAERTVISTELARAMALPSGPRTLVHGVTSDTVVDTVMIQTLEFGNQRFQQILAPVFPRADLGSDGLVGLDTLGRFELIIDFVETSVLLRPNDGEFITFNRGEAAAGRLGRTPARAVKGRFGQLLLPTEVEGVAVDAFVDSGAQYSIGNRALQSRIGRDGARGPTVPTPIILGVNGTPLQAEAQTASRLRIARRSLGPTPLLFSDLHVFSALGLQDRPALLLGADILTRFETVALDYARGRITVGPLRRRRPRRGI
jgi:predicted aspartyl protease